MSGSAVMGCSIAGSCQPRVCAMPGGAPGMGHLAKCMSGPDLTWACPWLRKKSLTNFSPRCVPGERSGVPGALREPPEPGPLPFLLPESDPTQRCVWRFPGPQSVPRHPGHLSPMDDDGSVLCWGHPRDHSRGPRRCRGLQGRPGVGETCGCGRAESRGSEGPQGLSTLTEK